jgi:ankyrin repeat protein
VGARWAVRGVRVSANRTSRDALFAAIQRGAASDVERLLDGGASANAVGGDGIPALMAATLFADAHVVDLLLKHGADPNRTGPAGTTALMWAAPSLSKARLLVGRGANISARSDTERTPLLVAASYPGTVDVLRLLIDHGADLRAQDRAGDGAGARRPIRRRRSRSLPGRERARSNALSPGPAARRSPATIDRLPTT